MWLFKVKIVWNFLFLQDKYKRALADTENLRQRSQKLVEEAKLYGKSILTLEISNVSFICNPQSHDYFTFADCLYEILSFII